MRSKDPLDGAHSRAQATPKTLRQKLRYASAIAGVVLAALIVVAVPGAVNPAGTDTFELDGNALASATPGDDWDCVFGTPPAVCQDPPTPTTSTHVQDPVNDNDDEILGGGSKDILPLTGWTRVLQKPPAKDDIANAAWASYSVNVGGEPHDIVYFTADRISNNGDAYMGFWFFKDKISVNPDGSFSGQHTVGDTLVLVDFIQGSGQKADVQEIGVYKWVGTDGDVSGTLQTVVPLAEGSCALMDNAANACAQFNSDTVPSAFPFQSTDSHDPANTYTKSEFVEGAIDLTAALQGDDCFSSVMAETRSSSSVTAEQKDIVLGELNTCGTIVIKKHADPDDPQAFGFHAGPTLSPATFSLVDNATPDANEQKYLLVKPGQYTVSEDASPVAWSL